MSPRRRNGRAGAHAARGGIDGGVRAEALRGYPELVRELGGDPRRLLARARIPPAALQRPDTYISYRDVIALLELSAGELACPDFGLRLAARQGGTAILGPLDLAMRNCSTVGEAFRYCAAHVQIFSPLVQIAIEDEAAANRHVMRVDLLLRDLPSRRQALEHALGLSHFTLLTLSGNRFGARELWFMHEPGMPYAAYRMYLSGKVRFGMPFDAVVFRRSDFTEPVVRADRPVYELAAKYIDIEFPAATSDIVTKVRLLATRRVQTGGACTPETIAQEIALHPRALQRRLRSAGTSFTAIRDEARRDCARHYLIGSRLPLTRIATLLGYSETSVLTRSCRRWFGCAPSRLRERGRT